MQIDYSIFDVAMLEGTIFLQDIEFTNMEWIIIKRSLEKVYLELFKNSKFPRVNLSASFQKIFDAEKELFWLLVHVLVQKEALKQWAIQCLIVSNNGYQLFSGPHY